MFNSLHPKNVSCLAVAGIYPPKHLRRRTATLISPATCWRGSLASPLAARVARKNNLIMQNEPKLQNDKMNVTPLLTKEYGNYMLCGSRKNEPKRTQNEPNFGPKLASFFPNRIRKDGRDNRNVTENCLYGLGIFVMFRQNLRH